MFQTNPVEVELFSHVKRFPLFQQIFIDAGHVGKTLIRNFCVRFGIPSRNAGCFLRLPSDTKKGNHYKFLGNCPPTPPLSQH